MKRIATLTMMFVFLAVFHAHALSWAYPFVVWEGKVYEVKLGEKVEEDDIGRLIGEVKTKADEVTGNYYGDASNYYPVGTNYYARKGVPVSSGIAVKEEGGWVKASYVHRAPFHIMNVITSGYFITFVTLSILAIVIFKIRNKALSH
ncbi:hypothetical protein LCM10_17910 [Rossellomorea aquimaris]|uniref:hypothetical protein n=1 Tax=Rossellomorea aquimaris TaxID=189382 RepID=UPI001CD74A9E|nr:hypothetical protein [Rossellomorea aquimaris]MCA1056843.1 hypothetical protein [Rossellomorea aquimaris]